MLSRVMNPKERDGWLVGSAWGVFLIGVGCIWLTENLMATSFEGLGTLWAGVVLLGLNAIRYASHLRMSKGTLILGTVFAALGGTEFAGMNLPLIPILLIVIGGILLVDALRGGGIFKRGNDDYATE